MGTPVDYSASKPGKILIKPRLYSIILWVMACDLILAIIRMCIYGVGNIIVIRIVFILFPLMALALLWLKKKAGWIMSVFYFELDILILCTFFYSDSSKLLHLNWYNVYNIFFIVFFSFHLFCCMDCF